MSRLRRRQRSTRELRQQPLAHLSPHLARSFSAMRGSRTYDCTQILIPSYWSLFQCFECTRHRTKPQLTIRELGLGSADPRRADAAQRRHRQVLAGGHQLPHAGGELRLSSLELRPRCHDLRRYLDPMSRAVEELNRRMLRARDAIDRAYAQPLDIHNLAEIAFVSEAHFIRAFRATFGETPHRYLQRRRVERAMFKVCGTERNNTDLCFDVALNSLGTFSRTFRDVVGVTPSEYRDRAEVKAVPSCFTMAYMRPSSFGEARSSNGT